MFGEAKVAWMVRDIERSVRFYPEALGLDLRSRDGHETAELNAAGLCLRLHRKRPEILEVGSGTAALGLGVADIAAAATVLATRGVAVGRVLPTSDGAMALFDDPDGNHLYLFERRAR